MAALPVLRSPSWAVLAACLGGVACAPGNGEQQLPDEIAGCAERSDAASCRTSWMVANWTTSSDAVVAAIEAEADPVARIASVNRLAEAYPGGTARLCPQLDKGPARDRCNRISSRGHLMPSLPGQPTLSAEASSTTRAGGGPATTRLGPPSATPRPYRSVPPAASPAELVAQSPACAAIPDPTTCASEVAEQAAEAGDLQTAVGACNTVEAEKWRSECTFNAAEKAVLEGGAEAYAAAVDTCLEAGDFAANCQAHLLYLLARSAPLSESAPVGWTRTRAGADAVAAAWAVRAPEFTPLVLDRYWSDALAYSYASAEVVTGDPLAEGAVPDAFHRHVRAAAAGRLLVSQGRGNESRSLDDWVSALRAALGVRVVAERSGRRTARQLRAAEDTWPVDGQDEAARPATFFLGTARRTWSSDPVVDSTISILEAAMRWQPHGRGLIEQGKAHRDEGVRWTAERLGAALELRDQAPPGPQPR